jgi:4-amino-4-deoxy-L-arabinose transferase-like glycosyltransferase
LSVLAIAVGVFSLFLTMLLYLAGVYRLLHSPMIASMLASRVYLVLTFFLSFWLVVVGYYLKRENEKALFISSLFFGIFWITVYILSQNFKIGGFTLDSLAVLFPLKGPAKVLFYLDCVLCLWIAVRARIDEITPDFKEEGALTNAVERNSSGAPNLKVWILMASLLVSAGALRFYKLTTIGLRLPDDFFYTAAAYRWSQGVFDNCWAKPGYHLLGAGAMKLLGVHDYSLAYLNSFCDILNILLIFFIARRLGMKSTVACGVGLVYAFMPSTILYSRSALVHTSSITFLLFSFWMLLKYLREDGNIPYLVLSGMSLAYAGNIHPTLLCFPPLYGLAVAIRCLRRPINRRNLLMSLVHEIILAISFAAVFAGFVLLIHMASNDQSGVIFTFRHDVMERIFVHKSFGTAATALPFSRRLLFSFKAISDIASPLTYAFICVALALQLVSMADTLIQRVVEKKKQILSKEAPFIAFIWVQGLWLLVSVSLFSSKAVASRIFALIGSRVILPVVPFLIIAAIFSIQNLWKSKKARSTRIILCICVFLVIGNFAFAVGNRFHARLTTPSKYHQIAEILGGRLSDQQRLLITPSCNYRRIDPFSLYLADNYQYVPWENPKDYPTCNSRHDRGQIDGRWIEENYEYISADWDPARFLSGLKERKIRYVLVDHPAPFRSQTHRLFSPWEEHDYLVETLESIGANLIFESPATRIYFLPSDLQTADPPPSTLSAVTLVPEP